MNVSQIVETFLAWNARHRKPATVRHYEGRLRPFVEEFGEREFVDLTPLDVDGYLDRAGKWPDGRPKAADTRRANIVAFETLQSWAVRNRLISEPIVDKLEKPRGQVRRGVFTPQQVRTVLHWAKPEFALIFKALLRSGARPAELTQADISQIESDAEDPSKRMLVITDHKTSRMTAKPRRIAVGRKLGRLLDEAIGERTSGPIFLTPQGRAWTTQTVSATFRRVWDKAGLPEGYCLYLARHTHGTQITKKFGIFAASQSLGHTDVRTTQRHYAQVDDDYLRDIQDVV